MSVWAAIEETIPVFQKTFAELVDFDKFNRIAMTFHSTAIEGSTLTPAETEVLLDKALTPKGKPVVHQNMVLDHHKALALTLELAQKKTPISVSLIQQIAAAVMQSTGATHNTPLGTYDVSKGDLRLNNVRAGEQYFVNYDKVPFLVEKLATHLQSHVLQVKSLTDSLRLSFEAHFELVSIHPFGDGNGRTSRLLMNFIQHIHKLPLGFVFYEDRTEYIAALMQSRNEKSLLAFEEFMASQYLKHLRGEIEKFENAL